MILSVPISLLSTMPLYYSHDGTIGGKQPAGSVSSIVCSPGAGLLIESWALLPLMVTGVGLPSTVMVTCSPEWLVLVRVSLACNFWRPPLDWQRAWKETRSPHGIPPPPLWLMRAVTPPTTKTLLSLSPSTMASACPDPATVCVQAEVPSLLTLQTAISKSVPAAK